MERICLRPKKKHVLLNVKTLHYCSCNVYIKEETKSDWIQIPIEDLKQYLNDTKVNNTNGDINLEVKSE